MNKRNAVLASRIAQYLLVLAVTLAGVWVLMDGAGETSIVGIKGKTVYAAAGMALAMVVTVSFSRWMFTGLPAGEATRDDYDGLPGSKALGRVAEIKYSKRAGRSAGKFEDYYSVGRRRE